MCLGEIYKDPWIHGGCQKVSTWVSPKYTAPPFSLKDLLIVEMYSLRHLRRTVKYKALLLCACLRACVCARGVCVQVLWVAEVIKWDLRHALCRKRTRLQFKATRTNVTYKPLKYHPGGSFLLHHTFPNCSHKAGKRRNEG